MVRPTAIVLGTRVQGLAGELPLDARVTIPIQGTESLNVARWPARSCCSKRARQRRMIK